MHAFEGNYRAVCKRVPREGMKCVRRERDVSCVIEEGKGRELCDRGGKGRELCEGREGV